METLQRGIVFHDGQLGRRNLSPIQRVAVTEKYRPVFEKKAQENKEQAIQKARENNPNNTNEQFLQKSAETVKPIHTRKIGVAEIGKAD